MQHLIRKQIIALGLPKETDAFSMQQTVSDHYRQDILPVLEEVFDSLSDSDHVIRIDTIEIDLHNISEKDIKKDHWDAEILSKIKDQLYQKIKPALRDKTILQESVSLSIGRQWMFYMQKGYLPWNAMRTSENWYQQALEALAVDYALTAELRELIIRKHEVIKRIVQQHDEPFLVKLISILTAENQKQLPETISELQELFLYKNKVEADTPFISAKEIEIKLWEETVKLAAGREKKLTMERLVEKMIVQYFPDVSAIRTIIKSSSLKIRIIIPILKRMAEKPELFLEKKQRAIKKQDLQKKTEESVEEADKEIKPEKTIEEEGLFVQYAGIVLVHPFLTALFKRLQWVEEKQFKNKATKHKALYLLYYMATGRIAAEEHELAIPKILCDWTLNMPVEKDIELTEETLREADNMLQSAIEQWPVLKNTSTAGLREGFLQRNGKLFTRNNHRYLQVETRSIDVLLDQLPWNLSLIKLPWMKELLRVEWR